MNTLKSLSISGFKSIREMNNLELRPLNVLIGANGAGKSNLVSFFRMVQFIMKGALQEYVAKSGFANAIFHNGDVFTKVINASLDYTVNSFDIDYYLTLPQAAGGILMLSTESIEWEEVSNGEKVSNRISFRPSVEDVIGNANYKATKPLHTPSEMTDASSVAHSAAFSEYSYYPSIKSLNDLLSKIATYQFNDTSRTSGLRKPCRIDDNKALAEDGGNLAAILYYLNKRHPESYTSIIDTIRLALPSFEDFVLEPDKLNPDFLDWRWKETGNSYEFRPYQLSDGTLRFMALVTLLKLPPEDMPSLVIIDEPELGLHPHAIEILADLLKAASVSTQVIVSTQSVELVNHMDAGDVIVVERQDDQSIFKHLNEDDLKGWLTDYSLGELWQKNLLGGNPR